LEELALFFAEADDSIPGLGRRLEQKPDNAIEINSGRHKALDEAAKRSWTVVDMKQDWKTILPPVK
jgi:hypothetical protein